MLWLLEQVVLRLLEVILKLLAGKAARAFLLFYGYSEEISSSLSNSNFPVEFSVYLPTMFVSLLSLLWFKNLPNHFTDACIAHKNLIYVHITNHYDLLSHEKESEPHLGVQESLGAGDRQGPYPQMVELYP